MLGTNGSGKSTFLRVLAGLYEPTAGRIMLDNIDMGQIHPRDLRRGIGYLGQEVRLFSGTIRDNLNLSQLERDDDRLFAALDFAGLGQFIRNHDKMVKPLRKVDLRRAAEILPIDNIGLQDSVRRYLIGRWFNPEFMGRCRNSRQQKEK